MARENRTKYAILGLLATGPQSGYDLKKLFASRMSHFWAESVGQIYPTLRQLREEGWITSNGQTREGRPARRVHALTDAGRQALRGWLERPAAPDQLRLEIMLKFFFAAEIGPESALKHLQQYETIQKRKQEMYAAFSDEIQTTEGTAEQRLFWDLTRRAGVIMTEARLAWCAEARRALEDAGGKNR